VSISTGASDMHIDEELKQSAIARAGALAAGDTNGRDEGAPRGDDGRELNSSSTILPPRQRKMLRRRGCCARIGDGTAVAGPTAELFDRVGDGDS